MLGPVRGGCAGALLGLVRAATLLLTDPAGGRRGDFDGVSGDAPAARGLRQPLELVGRLVDRLQMALVLVLPSRRRDVGVPAFGHPTTRQLDAALVERRLQLQQQQSLFKIEDASHWQETLASEREATGDDPGALGGRSGCRPGGFTGLCKSVCQFSADRRRRT